jgi:hypothetical protein
MQTSGWRNHRPSRIPGLQWDLRKSGTQPALQASPDTTTLDMQDDWF